MGEIVAELGGLETVAPVTLLTITLLWVVRLVITGKIIPSETHQRIVDTKDERIAASEAAREKLNTQVERLTELAETMKHLLESLGGNDERHS